MQIRFMSTATEKFNKKYTEVVKTIEKYFLLI